MTGDVRSDVGVEHGAELIAFTEVIMLGDDAARVQGRARLRAIVSPAVYVDVAAIIAAFNVVDRIADATGIPLDPMMLVMSADVRHELRLDRFASAANTPGSNDQPEN